MDNEQTANLTDAFYRAIKATTKYSNICDGTIISVDETAYTADVQLEIDGEPVYYSVPLSVLIGSVGGFVPVPVIGSDCLITFRDGNKGRPQLLFCNEIDKLLVNCNLVQFNGGANGGMVEVVKLVDRLNKVEAAINNLQTWAATVSPPYTAQPLTHTQRGDIENTKITQ